MTDRTDGNSDDGAPASAFDAAGIGSDEMIDLICTQCDTTVKVPLRFAIAASQGAAIAGAAEPDIRHTDGGCGGLLHLPVRPPRASANKEGEA